MYAFTFLTYVAFTLLKPSGLRASVDNFASYPPVIHLDYSQLSPASQTAFKATMNVNVAGSVNRTQPPQNRSGPNIIVSSRDAFMKNSLARDLLLTVTAFSSSFQYKLSIIEYSGKVV